jgi:hypothetical protein
MQTSTGITCNYSEETIASWTRPPSDTEEAKLQNSERAVREAITQDPKLSTKSIFIFGQGSYANDTNVRLNSDIDINVRLDSIFYYDLPDGKTAADFGITAADYTYAEFKNDVEAALVRKFGRDLVLRQDKCIQVKESSTRVQTDVVPTSMYHRYDLDKTYVEGVEFFSDGAKKIVNFPLQHISNGKAKNALTQKRFKRLTRVFRKIRYKMMDDGNTVPDGITSFLMECLVWNVPDYILNDGASWTGRLRTSITYLYQQTLDDQNCGKWVEISQLLYLFHGGRKWDRQMVNNHLVQMWRYMGFEA